MRIGMVTGLAVEAACLRRSGGGGEGMRVRCTGVRAGAAAAAAAALVEEGCRGLVSFGTAGGLDPRLPPGTLLLPEAVILPDGARICVDPEWHQRLSARLEGRMPLVTDAIAAADAALLTPEAKAACRRATGAVAVDMESGSVALAADPSPSRYRGSLPLPLAGEGGGEGAVQLNPREPGGDEREERLPVSEHRAKLSIPFIVVRAIADPAERAVPSWVMAAVTADGRTAIRPVLSHLRRNPGDLPALLRLAQDARAALRSLRRVAALAGPLLAFDR